MRTIPQENYRIVISGLAGSGKSSVGKALAELLGCSFRSAGFYAREEARRRGITIQKLQIELEDDPEFDVVLDRRLIEWGRANPCWVMDYRMGFALLPEATSIYLTVTEEEAARRIQAAARPEEFGGNEDIHDILRSINERNQNMRQRLQGLYGKDFSDSSQYDHVIATDGKTPDELVKQIRSLLV